jgi:ribose-phosphate pyrophosphokinase
MHIVGPVDDFNRSLSEIIGTKIAEVERRVFPDGEICPRIVETSGLNGSNVVLSMRMKSGGNPNTYLSEVLFTIRNLREELKAGKIIAVIPYFPYARQDEIFRPGEPLSSRYVAEMLEEAGADAVISVTVHLHRIKSFSDIFSRAKAVNVSGFSGIARVLKNRELRDPVVIAPDGEGIAWAKELADLMGIKEYGAFKKERDLNTGEIRTQLVEMDLKGRDVLIADDIVSTGGTMVNALAGVRKMGARRAIAAFIHPVLASGAIDRILPLVDEVISSDTIEWPESKATAVREVADAVKELL